MEAFEQVLAEHRRIIERYVRFRIGQAADAEDVLQEVFSAAVTNQASLRENANFKA